MTLPVMPSAGFSGKATSIYVLIDPRTDQVRYVGKTVKPLKDRLSNHLTMARRGKLQRVARWVRGLLLDNIRPEIIEVELVPAAGDWVEAERHWIGYFRFLGADLVNQTAGGEGCSGFTHSADFAAFVAARNSDPSFKAKARAGLDRRLREDPDFVARRSAEVIAMNCSQNHRAKVSSGLLRAYAERPEIAAKIADKARERWSRPEFRDARKAAARELCRDPNHKTKMAAGAKSWMAERRAIFDRCQCLVMEYDRLIGDLPTVPTNPTHHSLAFFRNLEADIIAHIERFRSAA
jgi:hypothetical protein